MFIHLSRVLLCVLSLIWISPLLHAEQPQDSQQAEITEPLFKPFIERYILDEIKSLRQDQQMIRADVAEKMAASRLDAADRAVRYTADTTSVIFYIITASASILVVLGWKSISDIRSSIESTTTRKVEELTTRYEERLNNLEETIKERSEQIVAAQKEISESNVIHSLWMRAGLEKSEQEKVRIYDQILELKPNDVEALTYKADSLLDMDQETWALSLANQAIEQDSSYALAYWQRACAHAKQGHENDALTDIHKALDLSSSLQDELASESYFESLRDTAEFRELVGEA